MKERMSRASVGARDRKEKILNYYEKFNWVTLAVAVGVGGVIGLTFAAIDLTQIALIRKYRKRKNK